MYLYDDAALANTEKHIREVLPYSATKDLVKWMLTSFGKQP